MRKPISEAYSGLKEYGLAKAYTPGLSMTLDTLSPRVYSGLGKTIPGFNLGMLLPARNVPGDKADWSRLYQGILWPGPIYTPGILWPGPIYTRWYIMTAIIYPNRFNQRGIPDGGILCGALWRIGRGEAVRPEGRGIESRSSRYVGTFGKSFTHSCLWRFGVKLRHISIHAVSGAPLSSRGLEDAL